jgi:hypothetical protein
VLYTNRVIHLKQDYFLSCSRMAIVMAGWCQTHWLATVSTWYDLHQEYAEWGEENYAGNLAWPP